MSTRVRVPIRVRPAFVSEPVWQASAPDDVQAAPSLTEREPLPPVSVQPEPKDADEGNMEMWRDRAQRLQAEMENFRKRHQRLADERVTADRERLLRAFLDVADNLERALNADGTDVESLRQGISLTHQTMERLLNQEGAELVQAKGQPFDPTWHEAVSTIPHQNANVEPSTVAEVVQAGYRVGDRLLRPARVIVAT
ncbi:MAG: nucleotide exchange factor GrpE [Chloroflexi bacterium]|nr:nucleotide exchange factor GrpE [Chloroflexota bacterium]